MRERKFLGMSVRVLGFLALMLIAVSAFSVVTVTTPSVAMAQDGDAAEDDGGNDEKRMSMLAWTYQALGLGYMLIFLGLSFTLVALFVMNILTARRENVCPVHLVEGFEGHLNEKRYQEAFEMAKNDDSFLGQVLAAGLAKLSSGYAQAIEAMQEVGEEENMKLARYLDLRALYRPRECKLSGEIYAEVQPLEDPNQWEEGTYNPNPNPITLIGGLEHSRREEDS